jgi:hypothetical protein
LTNIVTPIAGWTAVTNAAAGTLGRNAYTDSQLRVLREQEIAQSGSCANNALRARILVNRSDGTSRAITDIAAAMIRNSSVTATYVDTYDFKWQISFFNILASFSYAVVAEWANMLRQAKALGSGTDIIYSGTSTDHSLIWCTVAEQNTTTSQWDTVAGAGKGEWSLYA